MARRSAAFRIRSCRRCGSQRRYSLDILGAGAAARYAWPPSRTHGTTPFSRVPQLLCLRITEWFGSSSFAWEGWKGPMKY
eukprot:6664361-Pyramimonas_sp.AAC.2